VRTAWGGLGGGGSGRSSADNGFVVDVIEYIGDAGTGGSCEGVGETGRDVVGEAIVAGCWTEDEPLCWWFVYTTRNESAANSITRDTRSRLPTHSSKTFAECCSLLSVRFEASKMVDVRGVGCAARCCR
jgi:hypothetical protein